MITLHHRSERDFRILNLTDPQLSSADWKEGCLPERIFRTTAERLIQRVSPDLITVSGDLSYAGDLPAYRELADRLDSFGIPWTCCFGNHDNQDGPEAVQKVLDEYGKHPCFVFEDCDADLGKGNFVVRVEKNGKTMGGIFLMDTHDREPCVKCGADALHWGTLSEAQLRWYEEGVARLQAQGCRETTLIAHIPIHAYQEAFKAAFAGRVAPESVSWADSLAPDLWKQGYEDSCGVGHEPVSCSPHDDGALALIKRLGSTRTLLCGHNHCNNWMVTYQGIRFVFGLKIGPGGYWDPSLNGGTVVSIGDDGAASVHHEFVDVSDLL